MENDGECGCVCVCVRVRVRAIGLISSLIWLYSVRQSTRLGDVSHLFTAYSINSPRYCLLVGSAKYLGCQYSINSLELQRSA